MKLRRALQNLLGQVKQARDGFGIYQQSKSMDSAVKEAEAALAEPSSDVFGPEPPLAAKLGETKFSDRWGRQWLFIDASNSLGNVLKAPPSELGIINREEIIATPSGPSAHELMLAVTKVKVAGLWKFDQPKWYEAMAEALLHLRQEATPSGPKETSMERPPEGIQHPDWGYDPDGNWVRKRPASDLKAKLESLRELSEKATAGEWRIEKRGETVVTLCAPVAHEQDDPRIAYFYGAFADKADKQTPNAEFAVACVNAVRVIIEGKN